jgi:hypothetical protein
MLPAKIAFFFAPKMAFSRQKSFFCDKKIFFITKILQTASADATSLYFIFQHFFYSFFFLQKFLLFLSNSCFSTIKNFSLFYESFRPDCGGKEGYPGKPDRPDGNPEKGFVGLADDPDELLPPPSMA